MTTFPTLRTALGTSLLALLSACGGPKQSPQTQAYLQQVDAAINQLNGDLAQEPAPEAPVLPKLSQDETPAEGQALKQFGGDLAVYYAAVGKMTDRVIAICDRLQSKTHGLDTTEVDAAAVDLANRYVGLTDRRQQLAVNLSAFMAAQRAELDKGQIPRYATKLVSVGVAALLAPTAGGNRLGDFEPTAEEKSEMTSQARSVQQAIAQWRTDAAAVTAARSDLQGALKAKYPGDDWNFLASP